MTEPSYHPRVAIARPPKRIELLVTPDCPHAARAEAFEDRFLTASRTEQELLLRMPPVSESSHGSRPAGGDAGHPNINELLRRLVARGLLYRPTRGTYRFALPLVGRYLRRHRKSHRSQIL